MNDTEIEQLFGEEWELAIEMVPILPYDVLAEVVGFNEFEIIQIHQDTITDRNIILQFEKVLQELIDTF